MRLIPFVLMLACTVGLVDETKPVEPLDTAVADTEDTSEDTDTQDSDTDTLPDSENPYNGECSDNLDNDGDGQVDCNDSDCAAAPECNESSDGDTDGDGYLDDDDCDPYNPYVNPGATEIDNNGVDDDCDGTIDSGNSGGGSNGGGGNGGNPTPGTVCSDTCTDGFGNILYGANDGNCQDGGFGDFVSLALGSSPCSFGTDCSDCGIRTDADGDFHEDDPLNLGLALYSDCDDSDPTVNSSATEVPNNGKDDDCDGTVDNSSSGGSGTTTETDCSNGADDDADGDVDCDDSDCSSDPACTSSSNCASYEVEDCIGNCVLSSWVGDGVCDVNLPSWDLDCEYGTGGDFLNYDGGDCSSSGGSGGTGGSLCTDSCTYSGDNVCDDGGVNSSYSVCSFGTDCADCGTRSACEDTCSDSNDGVCDDGGPNDSTSYQSVCDRGTDCADCGSY